MFHKSFIPLIRFLVIIVTFDVPWSCTEAISSISLSNTRRIVVNSSCTISKDCEHIGGLVADCRGKGFTSPPSNMLPTDTTTLLLQQNSISSLDKDSFVRFSNLKVLKLSYNNLQHIEVSTFQANRKLVSLDLENNYLNLDGRSGFPGGLFDSLQNLTELRLSFNHNDAIYDGNYPPSIFNGLINLQILTIDTFHCELNFSMILQATPNLSSLTITGGVTKISNESFQFLGDSIKLKSLVIRNADNLWHTEQGAFLVLKNLDSLALHGGKQGVKETMESLASLTNRSLVSLILDSVNDATDIAGFACSVLTQEMTRYLRQICIQHVTLTDNGLLYVEHGALSVGRLSRCVQSLDLSGNPLVGDNREMIGLARFQALRSFRFINRKFSFLFRHGIVDDSPDYLQCLKKNPEAHSSRDRMSSAREYNRSETCVVYSKRTRNRLMEKINDENSMISSEKTSTSNIISSMKLKFDTDNITGYNINAIAKLFLPHNFEIININRFSTNIGPLDVNYIVKGGENLREIHVADCGLGTFTGRIKGIESVEVLDLSKNDGSSFTMHSLDAVPNLKKLNISQMNINKNVLLQEGRKIFMKLQELTSIDMSGNDIHIISSNIFSTNTKITAVGLASNRFKTIPIDLSVSPNMCLLDLRHNSILKLDDNAVEMLDTHGQRVKTFSLWLQGNVFSCGCSSIRFLSWLQRTKIQLDADRNYQCIMENGDLIFTQQMKDLNTLWRKCYGKTYFLISLIVASLMCLGYCVMAVGMKFQTHLKASFVNFIGKSLPLMQRNDYEYDAYFGYSDNDVTLVCEHLRHSIETRLGYRRTYIHHRDMIPASDIAESIVTAMNASWRVLLVMTEDFLRDDWSFLSIKWAIYSVNSRNPDRLVLIFTSYELPRHPILASVLKVVPESNVVYLTASCNNGLSPQEERTLAYALCH